MQSSRNLVTLALIAGAIAGPGAIGAGKAAPFDYIKEADRQKEQGGALQPGQQVVRIESRDGKYRYAKVRTDGYVRLYRQLSSGPGRQGTDWGFDQRGIWVNHGFRGEFVIGMPTGRPAPDRPEPGRPDRNRPPAWAVGTFRGYDTERNADILLTIQSDGGVRLRSDSRAARQPMVNRAGFYEDGKLRFSGATLELDRVGGAIRTTEQGGRHSKITYRREG
jgi:DUF3011 family protein